MARRPRIEFPGAFYHVTSRGIRKQAIFGGDDDRTHFLNGLCKAHERFGVVIHVYCLMENHYHLFLQTPDGNLSRTMHLINFRYAHYFNREHAHCGHAFQSRFWATLVQAKEYAQEVAPYIHLNPVRAHIVERPEDYEWSNYREYLGTAPSRPWTESRFVLGLFGNSLDEARKAYREQVLARMMRGDPDPLAAARKTGILGNPDFVTLVTKAFSKSAAQPERPSQVRLSGPQNRPDMRVILKETESELGPRSRFVRNVAIYIGHTVTDHSVKTIGEFFSLGEPAVANVCRRMKRELEHNITLTRAVDEIVRRLLCP
ncbi:MAG: hypothetical protein GX465_09020 [Acidobacteria bacterium]|nr:hypothetical protein [Acidobacteriota bacterium]